MTEWGTDWHGAALKDSLAAVMQARDVRRRWAGVWGEKFDEAGVAGKLPPLVIVGHSNGGQGEKDFAHSSKFMLIYWSFVGAWYLLSHYPDLVIGGLPASGWLKITDYVPYSLTVAAHYRDSALNAVSLTLHSSCGEADEIDRFCCPRFRNSTTISTLRIWSVSTSRHDMDRWTTTYPCSIVDK